MASKKFVPKNTESPTTTVPSPPAVTGSTNVPGSSAFGDGTSGFTPQLSPGQSGQDNKRYESAIGVEGRKVTELDPATGEPVGTPEYEGYKAPSRQYETYGRILKTPFVPSLPSVPTVEPRYFSSDVDALNGLSRGSISSWQSRLNAAGLLGNNFALGIVDNQTRSAYTEVLAVANREGVTQEEAIAMIQQRRVKVGGGSVQRYRMTNPTDLKVVIRSVAQNALGRNLDDADINKLVKLFQQEEVSAQKQYSAGGAVAEAPSAEQFVQSKIQADFGEEVSIRKLDQVFSAVDEALSGR